MGLRPKPRQRDTIPLESHFCMIDSMCKIGAHSPLLTKDQEGVPQGIMQFYGLIPLPCFTHTYCVYAYHLSAYT